jgi:peroxiredoxin family protein
MADRVAVVVYSGNPQAVNTALNLLAVAVAMEAEAHAYFTGDGVVWVSRPDNGGGPPEATAEAREEIGRRLRELKDEGALHVYACTRAMKDHNIPPENLAPEVDMPAGFAYFLEVASGASIMLSF